MTTESTATVALVQTAGLSAIGLILRGKQIKDDWQVHALGCRDLLAIQKVVRGRIQTEEGTIAELRESFNADLGEAAGFTNGGWDFDTHVNICPCARRK